VGNSKHTPGNANLRIGEQQSASSTIGIQPNAIAENGAPRWHSRGYLPHFESPGATQHVTFHLADSLPKTVLLRLEAELKTFPAEKRDVERRKRIDAWIDAGHGSCILRKLLSGLAEKGFGADQMREMQKIINAENSDLFDVLAYVAYALPTLTREERAAGAKVRIRANFNDKQQLFLDFVLAHYVKEGVQELDQEKLTPLLRLRYHDSIADALADLGKPEEIGTVFAGFQKYLYQQVA
jgi:hypothetical protein